MEDEGVGSLGGNKEGSGGSGAESNESRVSGGRIHKKRLVDIQSVAVRACEVREENSGFGIIS